MISYTLVDYELGCKNMKNLLYCLLIGALVLIAIGGLISGPIVASEYATYTGETTCIILNVEIVKVHHKTGTYDNFKYTYEYEVNGETFTNITTAVWDEYEVNDQLTVKYDRDFPEKSLLKCEKDSALSWTFSIAFVLVLLIGLHLYTRPNYKY